MTFGRPDDEKQVECPNPQCGWSGQIRETRDIEVNSTRSDWMALAGREGIEYRCPKCGFMVDHWYWRMS